MYFLSLVIKIYIFVNGSLNIIYFLIINIDCLKYLSTHSIQVVLSYFFLILIYFNFIQLQIIKYYKTNCNSSCYFSWNKINTVILVSFSISE